MFSLKKSNSIHSSNVCTLIPGFHTNKYAISCLHAKWYLMDPPIPRFQTILQLILLSIDSLESQCHLSLGTYELWYHLNPPSLPIPEAPSYNMPLDMGILLRINPLIEFQLITSHQFIPWEGSNAWPPKDGIILLCWCCMLLISYYSTWSPNMIHLENSSLLSPMYKGRLVVLQALSMHSCRGMLWNS